MPGKEIGAYRRALERATKEAFSKGYQAAVAGAMTEGLKVPRAQNFRMGLFGWNRHGKTGLSIIEFGNGAKNKDFDQKIDELRTAIAERTGVLDPSPVEVGYFLGQHGGPINPMETVMLVFREWSGMVGAGEYGEKWLGEENTILLFTLLRNVMGGFYAGARSRGAEALEDEAMEAMRHVPKARRF